jgi:hypothetical protein
MYIPNGKRLALPQAEPPRQPPAGQNGLSLDERTSDWKRLCDRYTIVTGMQNVFMTYGTWPPMPFSAN